MDGGFSPLTSADTTSNLLLPASPLVQLSDLPLEGD